MDSNGNSKSTLDDMLNTVCIIMYYRTFNDDDIKIFRAAKACVFEKRF